MPSRRTHQKSRCSCFQCKRRKIKCDLSLPRCQNCLKRGYDCELAVRIGLALEHQKSFSNESDQDRSGGHGHDPFSFPASVADSLSVHCTTKLTKRDLMLINFYTASTSSILLRGDGSARVWQKEVLREAVSNGFLMHGILSLAGAHFLKLQPRDHSRLSALVAEYQTKALASFIPALGSIDHHTCHASFAFSSLILVQTIAFPDFSSVYSRHQPMQSVLQVFALQKGVIAILSQFWKHLELGYMSPIFKEFNGCVLRSNHLDDMQILEHVPLHVRASLEGLEKKCSEMADPSIHAHCLPAIRELRKGFAEKEVDPKNRYACISWPISLSPQYLDLLQTRHPVALAILAHYGYLIISFDGPIWSADWGRLMVQGVSEELVRCGEDLSMLSALNYSIWR